MALAKSANNIPFSYSRSALTHAFSQAIESSLIWESQSALSDNTDPSHEHSGHSAASGSYSVSQTTRCIKIVGKQTGGRVEELPTGHRVLYGQHGQRILMTDPEGHPLHECLWEIQSSGIPILVVSSNSLGLGPMGGH